MGHKFYTVPKENARLFHIDKGEFWSLIPLYFFLPCRELCWCSRTRSGLFYKKAKSGLTAGIDDMVISADNLDLKVPGCLKSIIVLSTKKTLDTKNVCNPILVLYATIVYR
jgi:hypothetical protein